MMTKWATEADQRECLSFIAIGCFADVDEVRPCDREFYPIPVLATNAVASPEVDAAASREGTRCSDAR